MIDHAFRAFLRLGALHRGAAYLLCSGALFALTSVLVRLASTELHPFQIVFFRNVFGVLCMAWWLPSAVRALRRLSNVGLYSARSLTSLISMTAWFYGVTVTPLSTATALQFTTPLFATLGAALLLGEIVGRRRWAAILIGFAGVLVAADPDWGGNARGVLVVLLSAAAGGLTLVTLRALSRTESPSAIVACFALMQLPLSLVPALTVWETPGVGLLPTLALLGIAATLAQFLATRAYALVEASSLAPFEFPKLIFAVFFGYVFFGEITTVNTWIGAAIIVCAGVYIVWSGRGSRD